MSGWAWLRIGAISGFLAVALGAFGAHSLRDRFKVEESDSFTFRTTKHRMLENFETAAVPDVPRLGPLRRRDAGDSRQDRREHRGGGLGFPHWDAPVLGEPLRPGPHGSALAGGDHSVRRSQLLVGWLALAVAASRSSQP